MATRTTSPSLPEDESMDPVGQPYPQQEPLKQDLDEDLTDFEGVPFDEPDIAQDEESERFIQPE